MSLIKHATMRRLLSAIAVSAALIVSGYAQADDLGKNQPTPWPVTSFPKTLSKDCRDGTARVYDECGSQQNIIKAAQAEAIAKGKTTLVVYGAEWCVWCHIFDDLVKGDFAPEYFEWVRDDKAGKWQMQAHVNTGAEAQARALNQFVSEHFVIAHIEGDHAPDGPATISSLGFDESDVNFYPFIFTLNPEGQYVEHMLAYKAMPHNDSRKNKDGQPLNEFNRDVLLNQLERLKNSMQLPR